MKIVKNGKTYDTANGSEQPVAESNITSLQRRQARQATQQWTDDGGSAPIETVSPIAELPAVKPTWSVLSLADLNAAILSERADEPRRRRIAQEQARLKLEQRAANVAEETARAERNRYRNAWEHT
jgi:hypothetical protein